jgi:transcriptional regulator with XRE-family HTH domain
MRRSTADDSPLALRRRSELSSFLRDRRARLDPAKFGFAASPRRRVKGLSRDEIAALVGIGSSYYAWIEQGRPLNISDDVRSRVARVFALDRVETAYLDALCNPNYEHVALVGDVAPEVSRLLEGAAVIPAFALNQRWDFIAANETARRVFFPGGEPDGEFSRNLLWSFFTRTRELIAVRRESVAERIVQSFRLVFARHAGTDGFERLVRSLESVSDEFAQAWKLQRVRDCFDGPVQYEHPILGPLSLTVVSTLLASEPGVTLCFGLPDGTTQTILRATR